METKERVSLKSILMIIFSIVLIELILSRALHELINKTIISIGLIRIVQVISILTILYLRNETGLFLSFRKDAVLHGFKRGLIWSFGFGMCVLIAGMILYITGADPFQMFRGNPPAKLPDIVMLYAVGALIAPVSEEIVFRGVLYCYFRRWGVVTALAVSTLLFVLAHAFKTGVPLPQIIGGILFAVSYELEDNLLTPITIHILGNATIFSFVLLV